MLHARGGIESLNLHERATAPKTISAMPKAIRRSKFSRKTNQAISVVKTRSAFSRRDAAEAGMRVSPHMSSTGPTMPPMDRRGL